MTGNFEIATLAGGCFWCTEAIFRRLIGVVEVVSGYAGGAGEYPNYEQVSSGQTGHAEAVQIKFDPTIISYQKILDVFWATHDPTTLNRQGNDIGTQYRSVIFYHNPEQQTIAEKSLDNLSRTETAGRQIVTEIIPFQNFYKAESYHQQYYEVNKNSNPYCSLVIGPKINKLIEKFNSLVNDQYLPQD